MGFQQSLLRIQNKSNEELIKILENIGRKQLINLNVNALLLATFKKDCKKLNTKKGEAFIVLSGERFCQTKPWNLFVDNYGEYLYGYGDELLEEGVFKVILAEKVADAFSGSIEEKQYIDYKNIKWLENNKVEIF